MRDVIKAKTDVERVVCVKPSDILHLVSIIMLFYKSLTCFLDNRYLACDGH